MPLLTGTVTDNPSQIVAVTATGGSLQARIRRRRHHAAAASKPRRRNPGSAAEPSRRSGSATSIPATSSSTVSDGKKNTSSYQVIFTGDLNGDRTAAHRRYLLADRLPAPASRSPPSAPPAPRTLSTASFADDAPGTLQFTPAPATCPESSKIGIVRIDSPAVLDHPLFGNVYLASPGANPFGSLLAIYIVVEDPTTGIVVKLPGKVEADPQTGQLSVTVSEAPQLPFEDLQVELFKGTSAPLRTGLACGTYTVETQLTPWSAPEAAVRRPKDSFTIAGGAGAGACVSNEAAAPATTKFEAGTVEPSAGTYSPFTLTLSRARRQPPAERDRHDPARGPARQAGRRLLLLGRRPGARRDALRRPGAGEPELSGRLPGRLGRHRRRRRPGPVQPLRHRLPRRPLQGRAAVPGGGHPGAGRALRPRHRRDSGSPSTSTRRPPGSGRSPIPFPRSCRESPSTCARSR